jgi:hypothetical protein
VNVLKVRKIFIRVRLRQIDRIYDSIKRFDLISGDICVFYHGKIQDEKYNIIESKD